MYRPFAVPTFTPGRFRRLDGAVGDDVVRAIQAVEPAPAGDPGQQLASRPLADPGW
jgi:hypothetical protein